MQRGHTLDTQFSQDVWLRDLQPSLSSNPRTFQFRLRRQRKQNLSCTSALIAGPSSEVKATPPGQTRFQTMISACILILFFTETAVWDPKTSQLELRRSRFLDPGIDTFWRGVSSISECQARLKVSKIADKAKKKESQKNQPSPIQVFFKIMNNGQNQEVHI